MSGESFMPVFLGDLLAATLDWTGEERALYLYLLTFQWFNGPLKSDPKRLARIAQYDEATFLRLWETVRCKFVPSDDGTGLINLKCEQHRSRVHRLSSARAAVGAIGGKRTQERKRAANAAKSEISQPDASSQPADQANAQAKGEANAQANEQAKNGANGKHPIQPNPTQTKQRTDPPRAQARVGPQTLPAVAGLDVTAWERFVAYRRDVRKPIKPASVQAAQRKLAGFGADQGAVVEQSIANGWQGLFALKTADKAAPNGARASDEAWERVVAHVRSGGYRVRGALGDARIDAAVKQIGGYSSIGQSPERELPFIARRFAAAFAVVS